MKCDRCGTEIFNEQEEIRKMYCNTGKGSIDDWREYRMELATNLGARCIEITESTPNDSVGPVELQYIYCNRCMLSLDKWRMMEKEESR
jgi:ribosomal protein L37E